MNLEIQVIQDHYIGFSFPSVMQFESTHTFHGNEQTHFVLSRINFFS